MRDAIERWGLVAALALGRMAFGYQFQSAATLGPELAREFGLGYAALGTLIGLYLAPGVFVALPGGLLGRRFGERYVLGGGLLLMTLGTFASAAAAAPGLIGAGRAVAGGGAVMLVVLQGKITSDRFQGGAFTTVMGLLVGAFPVGVGLCGLLHAPLARVWGWHAVLAAGGVISGAALLLFALSFRPGPRLPASWSLPSRRESTSSAVAGLIWTAYNAGYYGFLSYLPLLMAGEGYRPTASAVVLTVATWLNLPATVLGGALAARKPWGVLVVGSVAMAVAVAGPAVANVPMLWGVLFGTFAALHPGVIVAAGTLSARPEHRAAGMGLFYSVYYLGGAVIPALCGYAADLAGTPKAALLTAALLSVLTLPFWWLHRRFGPVFRA